VNRGAVVVVTLQGDYGKPRPALVVQSDMFSTLPSVTILPITSDLRDAPLYRIGIEASPETGLHKPSQIMVDKRAYRQTQMQRFRCPFRSPWRLSSAG
jgi:mRNA interferase MazF